MRLVLDTNVLLAAFIARGTCHDLLEHCERTHQLVGSGFILRELEDRLLRKFKVPPAKVAQTVTLLRAHMEIVDPPELEEPTCRDPDDDWILATAVEGGCECVVTGDKDLLSLETFSGIPILSPGVFWSFEAERERSRQPR